MFRDEKSIVVTVSLIMVLSVAITLFLPTAYAMMQSKVTSRNIVSASNSSIPLIQQTGKGKNSYDNSNDITAGNILHRGIISSEPGQPQQLKVQRTIILPHRQDGKDYTGILTFTATRPVEVLFGHRLYIDNKTLSILDLKKFGNLFLVNPIHPNAGYVLSAPTVIKPNYNGSSPPYYSSSLPFVASSVVLRTLGGIPFITVYEVNAHLGQPQEINNVITAKNSNSNSNTTNATK
ncbi:MAG TPA: hypothetical protein VE619_05545 [Nitrososphaeraceae archaeon]|nr:hypothetical protein [Nitrososphaeraceae archaeon]